MLIDISNHMYVHSLLAMTINYSLTKVPNKISVAIMNEFLCFESH